MIGHELTAAAGTDHAQTLALVLPAVLSHQLRKQGEEAAAIRQAGLGIEGEGDAAIDAIIRRTAQFFAETGMAMTLAESGLRLGTLRNGSEGDRCKRRQTGRTSEYRREGSGRDSGVGRLIELIGKFLTDF